MVNWSGIKGFRAEPAPVAETETVPLEKMRIRPIEHEQDHVRKQEDTAARDALMSKRVRWLLGSKKDMTLTNTASLNSARAKGHGTKSKGWSIKLDVLEVGTVKSANRGNPKAITHSFQPDTNISKFARPHDVLKNPFHSNSAGRVKKPLATIAETNTETTAGLPSAVGKRHVMPKTAAEKAPVPTNLVPASHVATAEQMNLAIAALQAQADQRINLPEAELSGAPKPYADPAKLVADVTQYKNSRHEIQAQQEAALRERDANTEIDPARRAAAAQAPDAPVRLQQDRAQFASLARQKQYKKQSAREAAKNQGRIAQIRARLADPKLTEEEVADYRAGLIAEQKKEEGLIPGGYRRIPNQFGVTSKTARITGAQLITELRGKIQAGTADNIAVKNKLLFDAQAVNAPNGYRRLFETDALFHGNQKTALLDRLEALSFKQCSSPNALIDLAYELSIVTGKNAEHAIQLLDYLGKANPKEELILAKENAVLAAATEELNLALTEMGSRTRVPSVRKVEGIAEPVTLYDFNPLNLPESARSPLQNQAIDILARRRLRRDKSEIAQHFDEGSRAETSAGVKAKIDGEIDWRYCTSEVPVPDSDSIAGNLGTTPGIRDMGWKLIQSMSTTPALLTAMKLAIADKDEANNRRYDFFMPVVKNITRAVNKANSDNVTRKAMFAERRAAFEQVYKDKVDKANAKKPGSGAQIKMPDELLEIMKYDAAPLITPEDIFGPARNPVTAAGMDAAIQALDYNGPVVPADILEWIKDKKAPIWKQKQTDRDPNPTRDRKLTADDLPDGQPNMVYIKPRDLISYAYLRNHIEIPPQDPRSTDDITSKRGKAKSWIRQKTGNEVNPDKVKSTDEIINETSNRLDKWVRAFTEDSTFRRNVRDLRHKKPINNLTSENLHFAAGGNMPVFKATSRLMPKAFDDLSDANKWRMELAFIDPANRERHIAQLKESLMQEAVLSVLAGKRFLEAQTGHPMNAVDDQLLRQYLTDRCNEISAFEKLFHVDTTQPRPESILDPDEMYRQFKLQFSADDHGDDLETRQTILQTTPKRSLEWIAFVAANRDSIEADVEQAQKDLASGKISITGVDNSAFQGIQNYSPEKRMDTSYEADESFSNDMATLDGTKMSYQILKKGTRAERTENLAGMAAEAYDALKIGGYVDLTSQRDTGVGLPTILTKAAGKYLGGRVNLAAELLKTKKAEVKLGLTGPRAYFSTIVYKGNAQNLIASGGVKAGASYKSVGLSGYADFNVLNFARENRHGEGVTLSYSRWRIAPNGLRPEGFARGKGDSFKMKRMGEAVERVLRGPDKFDREDGGLETRYDVAIANAPETINVNVFGETLDSRNSKRWGGGFRVGGSAGLGGHWSLSPNAGIVGGTSNIHEVHNEIGIGQTITSQIQTKQIAISAGLGLGSSAYTIEKESLNASIASLPGWGYTWDVSARGDSEKTLVIEVDGELAKNSNVLTTHRQFKDYADALVAQADVFADLKYKSEVDRKKTEGATPRDNHISNLVEKLQKHEFARDIQEVQDLSEKLNALKTTQEVKKNALKTLMKNQPVFRDNPDLKLVRKTNRQIKQIEDSVSALIQKYSPVVLANLQRSAPEQYDVLAELGRDDASKQAYQEALLRLITDTAKMPTTEEISRPWGMKALIPAADTQARIDAIRQEHGVLREQKRLKDTKKALIKADLDGLLKKPDAEAASVRNSRTTLLAELALKKDPDGRYSGKSDEEIDRIDRMQEELAYRIHAADMEWAEAEMRATFSELDLRILDSQPDGEKQKRDWMLARLTHAMTAEPDKRETMAENVQYDMISELLVREHAGIDVAALAGDADFQSDLSGLESAWLDDRAADHVGQTAFRDAIVAGDIPDDLFGLHPGELMRLFVQDHQSNVTSGDVALGKRLNQHVLKSLPEQQQIDIMTEVRRHGQLALGQMDDEAKTSLLGRIRHVHQEALVSALPSLEAEAYYQHKAKNRISQNLAINARNDAIAAETRKVARMSNTDKSAYVKAYLSGDQIRSLHSGSIHGTDFEFGENPKLRETRDRALLAAAINIKVDINGPDAGIEARKTPKSVYQDLIEKEKAALGSSTAAEQLAFISRHLGAAAIAGLDIPTDDLINQAAVAAVRAEPLKAVRTTLIGTVKAMSTEDKMIFLTTNLGADFARGKKDFKLAEADTKWVESKITAAVDAHVSPTARAHEVFVTEQMIDEQLAKTHIWPTFETALKAADQKAAGKETISYIMTEPEKFDMRVECMARVGRMTYETLRDLTTTQSFLQFRELSESAFSLVAVEFNKLKQSMNHGNMMEAEYWSNQIKERLSDPETWESQFRMTYDNKFKTKSRGIALGLVSRMKNTATSNYLKTWDSN